MCGIAGLQGTAVPNAGAVVRRMTDAIAHRGPDAEGVLEVGSAVLGHRRLSIIDLSSASDQPFVSADGRYSIAFNGEIYNYRELKKELGDMSWRTGGDTEVLLMAFIRWGLRCLPKLHGMFAFALHDRETDELLVVRDRMGIKPLYWSQQSGCFLFASEVRALLASGLVPKRVDREALLDHLRYQTVHAPRTLVAGVNMLEAGHYLVSRKGKVEVGRWYDLPGSIDAAAANLSLDAVRKEVRDRLSRAVEKRLVSDVPFGAFLSGGIDSSAVVGLMAQASSGPVHTFSVVFDEEEFSEERYARIIAKKFNTEHTAIRLRPENMLELLPDALRSMDHPSADGPNTYVVSKVTKEAGVSMALSGLGGDEVFAGYPVFKRSVALYRRRWITALPVSMRKAGAALVRALKRDITGDKLAEILALPSFEVVDTYPVSRLTYSNGELDRLFGIHYPPPDRVRAIMSSMLHGRSGIHLLSQVSLGELSTYLQNVLLRDTDQMSMAHALEVRVPFLDHELVEFVLGVPDIYKYPHTQKKLLIDALGDLLPSEVVNRPKMGFTLPWEHWMRHELKDLCTSRLAALDARGLIGPGSALGLWNKFIMRDPRVNWSRVWSLVVLGDWLERHGIE